MAEFNATIDIDAPPSVVFSHLTTTDGVLAWMGQRAAVEAHVGGRFEVDVDGSPVRGAFAELVTDRRVVVTWGVLGHDDMPPSSTTVEFSLTPTRTGTRVSVTHRNLPERWTDGYGTGWRHHLALLKRHAERADP